MLHFIAKKKQTPFYLKLSKKTNMQSWRSNLWKYSLFSLSHYLPRLCQKIIKSKSTNGLKKINYVFLLRRNDKNRNSVYFILHVIWCIYVVVFTRDLNYMYVCNSVYCRMNVTSPTSENSQLDKHSTLQETYIQCWLNANILVRLQLELNQMYW